VRSEFAVRRSVSALVLAFALLAGLSLLGTGLAQDTGRQIELVKPLTPELRAIAGQREKLPGVSATRIDYFRFSGK
jgi:hypothetical protein